MPKKRRETSAIKQTTRVVIVINSQIYWMVVTHRRWWWSLPSKWCFWSETDPTMQQVLCWSGRQCFELKLLGRDMACGAVHGCALWGLTFCHGSTGHFFSCPFVFWPFWKGSAWTVALGSAPLVRNVFFKKKIICYAV